MKILVIGKSGQLARALTSQAQTSQAQTSQAQTSQAQTSQAQTSLSLMAIGRPEFDLTQLENVKTALADVAPDIVVNAAAYTAVDKAETEVDAAFALNETGPGLLATECEANAIPLIHISTDYVFDGEKTGAYLEDDVVAPTGIYGRSKRAGEMRVMENCQNHIILRTAWVFSTFGQNFVKTMLRLAGERQELNVVDDQIGNPTYAPHLADCILHIAQYIATRTPDEIPWSIYHAAGSGEASWCDLARETFNQSSELGGATAIAHPITTEQYPTPAKRPANSRLDCSKLKDAFGQELPDWRTGVKECLRELSHLHNID